MAILKTGHKGTTDVRVERDITIDRPADELYGYWRKLENLPTFMGSIDEIEVVDEKRSIWKTTTSDGQPLHWDADIIEDVEGESLGWASVKGAEVETYGSVHFTPAPGGRGTEVRLIVRFIPPPSARISEWFWNIFGKEPGDQLRDDLRRFKQLMELGEIVKAR